jgi:hypothetical protein
LGIYEENKSNLQFTMIINGIDGLRKYVICGALFINNLALLLAVPGTGATGHSGRSGATGMSGRDGMTGRTGPPGPPGLKGSRGPPGPPAIAPPNGALNQGITKSNIYDEWLSLEIV